MATSIYFDGRTTSIPGAYTKIDATGLDAVGVGATGIVALIGTAEGGQPVIDGDGVKMTPDEVVRLTNPQGVLNTYKSGNLREAGSIAFRPSNDPAIPGGAQQLICLKVNNAKPSTANLSDVLGGTALTLTSRDYGAFTEQLQVDVATGTDAGLNVTITNNADASTETYINLGEVTSGSTDMFTLEYDEPTTNLSGWDTMTASVTSSGVVANGTRDVAGTTDISGTGTMTVGAGDSAALDEGTTVYVIGDTASGIQAQALVLNDTTTPVTGSIVFTDVYGAYANASLAGQVDVTCSVGLAFTIPALPAGPASGVLGGVLGQTMFVANSAVSLSAGAGSVALHGLNSSGTLTVEQVAVGGTSTTLWSQINFIGTEDLTGTETLSATAAQTNNTIQTTLQSVNDYFNARRLPGVSSGAGTYSGFTFTLKTTQTTLDPGLLDFTDATPGAQSIDATPVGFSAILNAVVSTLDANSPTVKAARGTTGLPPIVVNTFLSGGEEGAATSTEYSAALELLKSLDVSTIVPLTGDSAIHTLVRDHCIYMAGPGKSERDSVVGLVHYDGLNPTTDVPTKTEIKDQIIVLNSRHVRACGQSVSLFNTAGNLTVFPPYFQATLVAAMQAGSSVGTSLTRKTMSVSAIAQDSSWSPMNDANEMIGYGLWFAESHRTGVRCVRNITTYLTDNNVAFVEASVNEAANFAVFNFRNELEKLVGQKGFAGTVNAARTGASQILDLLVEQGTLVQWQSLQLELNVDTLAVSVEIAPVIPINFVTATVHLVTLPISG